MKISTYNFLYTGGTNSGMTINAIYKRTNLGFATTTLHYTILYGSSSRVNLGQISHSHNSSNITFELRDVNSVIIL